MTLPAALRWVLDVGVAAGLVAALAAVAVFEPAPAAVALPAAAAPAAAPPPMPVFAFSDLPGEKTPPPVPPPPPPAPPPAPVAPPTEDPIDPTLLVRVGFNGPQRAIGLTTRPGGKKDPEKRLTFNEFGETNHTAVAVDEVVSPFFDRDKGTVVKDLPEGKAGKSTTSNKVTGGAEADIETLPPTGPYVVRWRFRNVAFVQWVNYEAGSASRKMDTLRVRYTMTNTDRVAHSLGVRTMIDTFIGSNDGVPFFIPGRAGVVDKPLVLVGKDVPDTVFALERNDLSDPGVTVVQLGLTPPPGADRPDVLAITKWPGRRSPAAANPLGFLLPGLSQPDTSPVALLDANWNWDWKGAKTFNGDSAITVFYEPRDVPPGGKRVVEFTYGLGSLSGGKSRNTELSLAPQGPFAPGKPFRLTAFVKNPRAGQAVTLTLPPGLSLAAKDSASKPVEVQAGVAVTKVDWLVTPAADFGGKATLSASLSGATKPETATIYVPNSNPVLHSVVVTGTREPGGLVRVTANVFNAKPGTMATVAVPAGWAVEAGGTDAVAVPAGPVAQPTWLVRVPDDAARDYSLAVRLANPAGAGAATITVRPGKLELLSVQIDGPRRAGGVLRVTAWVANPVAGLTAAVRLPAGLTPAPGETETRPVPAGRAGQVSWLVRVAPDRTGPAAVSVELAPSGGRMKTVVDLGPAVPVLVARAADDPPATPGRPFWVVARVYNGAAGGRAKLTLPPGMAVAAGGAVEIPLGAKTADGVAYAEAAWLVALEMYPGPTAELTVDVPGVGREKMTVRCDRGSVIR